MNDDLPKHLHATRDLLRRSLQAHEAEAVPPMPPDLLDDLEARLGGQTVNAPATARESWLDRVRLFIARPAFVLATVTAAIVLCAGVVLLRPKSPEVFRGSHAVAAPTARVVFCGPDHGERHAVEASGIFDASTLAFVPDAATANGQPNPKIVIDLSAREIRGYNAEGAVSFRDPLPAAAALPDAIVEALTRL